MSDFSADWLALREPADRAARSSRLARAIADVLADTAELRVVDLAAGTGANMRYLSEHLASHRAGAFQASGVRVQRQSWLLVDRDAALLARVPAPGGPLRCRVETRQVDLATPSEFVKARILDGPALVTASAGSANGATGCCRPRPTICNDNSSRDGPTRRPRSRRRARCRSRAGAAAGSRTSMRTAPTSWSATKISRRGRFTGRDGLDG